MRRRAAVAWRVAHDLEDDEPTPFLWRGKNRDGRAIDLGINFHDLRHTAISLMCVAGYRPEWVAERVGHSDGGALIFRNYRHLYPSEMTAVGLSLDALCLR